MEQARILLADDEPAVREAYAEMLRAAGHEVDVAADGEAVNRMIRSKPYDMLFTDLVFPPTDGITVLKEAKRIRPTMLVVVFTGFAAVEHVLQAFRSGAYEFLEKPVPRARLLELADRALEIRTLGSRRRRVAEDLESERGKVMQLKQQLGLDDPFQKFVGSSGIIQGFIETIREVVLRDTNPLTISLLP